MISAYWDLAVTAVVGVKFQSLIGILGDFSLAVSSAVAAMVVSIPDRDFR